MALLVAKDALTTMRAAAAAAHPCEACGILLGEEGWIVRAMQTRNVHPAPETHFEIDPQALIDAHRAARAGGPQVIGYFHSHPSGPAEPSATDRAMAAGDGRVWAIVAGGDIRFWKDGKDGFAALSFTIGDG
ncbi:Mov34/MPN/PAD-1 family protein [Erythrobacter tepidarius]|uniref:Mov34/MPN/PAD-1 family protein n=1 Tax=Erythrobacter tepidarius TaxID=60454 RepID=UPI000A374FDB|nr:M67 family metallopeptidase [Erythrobacter tepidarius]